MKTLIEGQHFDLSGMQPNDRALILVLLKISKSMTEIDKTLELLRRAIEKDLLRKT